MAQPTVYEASVYSDGPDARAVNVLHYEKSIGAVGPGDAANLGFALLSNLLPTHQACISSSWSLIRLLVSRLNHADKDDYDSGVIAYTGSRGASAFPAGTCGIIKKISGTKGRWAQGRIYVAGLDETEHTNSNFNTAGAWWTAFLAQIIVSEVAGGGTYDPVVWSRKTEALYQIIGAPANPILGHVRGRRPPAF